MNYRIQMKSIGKHFVQCFNSAAVICKIRELIPAIWLEYFFADTIWLQCSQLWRGNKKIF